MTAGAERVEAANFRRSFLIQLVVAGLATTAMHATRPTMTYRALALGASPLEIGLIQSAFSILPALTAVAIGRYIDRVGESRYLMLSLLTLAVGSLFATLAGGLLPLAGACGFFFHCVEAVLLAGTAGGRMRARAPPRPSPHAPAPATGQGDPRRGPSLFHASAALRRGHRHPGAARPSGARGRRSELATRGTGGIGRPPHPIPGSSARGRTD